MYLNITLKQNKKIGINLRHIISNYKQILSLVYLVYNPSLILIVIIISKAHVFLQQRKQI